QLGFPESSRGCWGKSRVSAWSGCSPCPAGLAPWRRARDWGLETGTQLGHFKGLQHDETVLAGRDFLFQGLPVLLAKFPAERIEGNEEGIEFRVEDRLHVAQGSDHRRDLYRRPAHAPALHGQPAG